MINFSFVGYPFTYFMSENPDLMRWRLVGVIDTCDHNSMPFCLLVKVAFLVLVSSASPLEVWWMWTPLSPKCSRPHSSTTVSPAVSARQQRLWTSKAMRIHAVSTLREAGGNLLSSHAWVSLVTSSAPSSATVFACWIGKMLFLFLFWFSRVWTLLVRTVHLLTLVYL